MTSLKSKELFRSLQCLNKTIRQKHTLPTGASSTKEADRQLRKRKTQFLDLPIVMRQAGKYVTLQGSSFRLVDYTSNDIFGLQHHPKIKEVEDEVAIVSGLPNQCYHFIPAQKRLEEKLAYLHGKEHCMVSTETFTETLQRWLKHFGKACEIYVHQNSVGLVGTERAANSFQTNDELQVLFNTKENEDLKAAKKSCARLVLVEAGSDTTSIQQLDSLCKLAVENKASVVLLDPHGMILVRHALGDLRESLDILKKPVIIQSNMDIVNGPNSFNYIVGPREVIHKCQQMVPVESQTLDPPVVAKSHKAFQLIPMQSSKAYDSLLHTMKLKTWLSGLGVKVVEGATSLKLVFDENDCIAIANELRAKGHHVRLSKDGRNPGLEIMINGYHEKCDIKLLKKNLEESLKSHEIITGISENQHTNYVDVTKYFQNRHTPKEVSRHSSYEDASMTQRLNYDGSKDTTKPVLSDIVKDMIVRREMAKILPNEDLMDNKIYTDNLYQSTAKKIIPEHLQKDLEHLLSVYCTPMFDEKLIETLSFIDDIP